MGTFITTLDFIGEKTVATDKFTEEQLDNYINSEEVSILNLLLGVELYNEFLADYNAPTEKEPTSDKFKVIFKPFKFDKDCKILISDGIKDMLVGFIYYSFIRDSKNKKNIGGTNKNKQANSESLPFVETNINRVYNDAVATYKFIQYYICWNPEGYDYKKYNGQKKAFNNLVM